MNNKISLLTYSAVTARHATFACVTRYICSREHIFAQIVRLRNASEAMQQSSRFKL